MKIKDYIYLFIIISLYLLILVVFKREVFTNKFDPTVVDRYLCSQDIPYEPPCKRLFLSDSDLYLGSGYLYVKGSDPTTYDFQVPPLLKYLFGYSILLFNNPYFVQIGFGVVFLYIIYLLGLKTFKKSEISLLTCLFVLVDPLFINLATTILLDLGQGVFLLSYFLSMFFYKRNSVVQGVLLGLLFTSKFWGGSIFFILIILAYLLYRREFNLKKYLIHLIVAFIVFCLIYTKTFVNNGGKFNIFFFELKLLNFYINHNVSSIFGASLFLFLTGYVKTWWGNREIIKSSPWSILWVIGLIISSTMAIKEILHKRISLKLLIGSMPFLYLVYLGVQAPFPRYFILILPFIYLVMSDFIYYFFKFNIQGLNKKIKLT